MGNGPMHNFATSGQSLPRDLPCFDSLVEWRKQQSVASEAVPSFDRCRRFCSVCRFSERLSPRCAWQFCVFAIAFPLFARARQRYVARARSIGPRCRGSGRSRRLGFVAGCRKSSSPRLTRRSGYRRESRTDTERETQQEPIGEASAAHRPASSRLHVHVRQQLGRAGPRPAAAPRWQQALHQMGARGRARQARQRDRQ